MNEDISQLIGQTALRNRQAFATLYRLTSAKLFGVTLRVLGNRAEAEEALQEVYVKIWNNSGKFAPSAYSPMSWLIAVARHHAIDRLRAAGRRTEPIDETFEIADDAPSPEAAIMAKQNLARINDCLGKLGEDRAAAVRAAYLQGVSYQEIADFNKIPINTVRTWLRRSLLKLRECLTS